MSLSQTDYFLDCSNMAVRNSFDWSLLCRVERNIWKLVFRQSDPDGALVSRLCGSPITRGGTLAATIDAPAVRHHLRLRPGTTDTAVLRYVFREWAFNMSHLARWQEIQAFLKAQHEQGRRPLIVD